MKPLFAAACLLAGLVCLVVLDLVLDTQNVKVVSK